MSVSLWVKASRYISLKAFLMTGPIYVVLISLAPILFNALIFIMIAFAACYFLGLRPNFIEVSDTQTPAGMRVVLTRSGRAIQGLRAGIVLRATPRITQGPFSNTRILLAKYSAEHGSVGFILNRSAVYNGTRINVGGPVDPNNISMLHNYPAPNSFQILPGLYLGGDLSQSVALNVLVLYGYAGWLPLQLDGEIRAGDWTIEGEADPTVVLAA